MQHTIPSSNRFSISFNFQSTPTFNPPFGKERKKDTFCMEKWSGRTTVPNGGLRPRRSTWWYLIYSIHLWKFYRGHNIKMFKIIIQSFKQKKMIHYSEILFHKNVFQLWWKNVIMGSVLIHLRLESTQKACVYFRSLMLGTSHMLILFSLPVHDSYFCSFDTNMFLHEFSLIVIQ